MIDKGEFSIHGVARDELGGLDLDLSVELGSRVGVDSPHRHQAAEVGAVLLVCFALALGPQLTAWPAAHVAGAVDCAVLLRLCGHMQPPVMCFCFVFFTAVHMLNNMVTLHMIGKNNQQSRLICFQTNMTNVRLT